MYTPILRVLPDKRGIGLMLMEAGTETTSATPRIYFQD